MTLSTHATALWPRHVVREVAIPDAALLDETPHAWLWLDGSHSSTLQDDVFATGHRFDSHWVWRGTDWEYTGSGYRAGPLLVPMDAALLDHYLRTWTAPHQGLILLGGESAMLITHLQHLRQITAANGDAVRFHLNAARPFEELCEALPSHRLTELLGPMSSVIWPAHSDGPPLWLRIDNPQPTPTTLLNKGAFALTVTDETALGTASHQWFLRNTAQAFAHDYPHAIEPLNGDELVRQFDIFIGEAGGLGITRERDIQHYLRLRLLYPQEPFVNDTVLRTILMARQADPRLRLSEAERHLQTVTPFRHKDVS
ncbi:hypothetical protein [Dyella sp. 20L07]|uniref:hypothetical protein n=1 Tax=Dyella sp. 20L07 TaxID=3384240 RepID=UPI003D28F07B